MNEWYQQGNWPLIGAIAALIFTNGAALIGILIQNKSSLKNELKVKQIEYISDQLANFYNPLFSLILLNQQLFQTAGPRSFPKDPISLDAAGENWKLLKEKSIIPNNLRIIEILRTNTHLLAENDSIANYNKLQTHLAMYSVFQDNPTDLYKKFQFPKNILRHIEVIREELIDKLNTLKRDSE